MKTINNFKFFSLVLIPLIFLNLPVNYAQDGPMLESATAETNEQIDALSGTQWSKEKADAWFAQQPWLIGANYLPSNAINQLEMWQADTWSPELINKELGWMENLGMNTLRVYLHDIPYRTDKEGFFNRIEKFLQICAKHNIRPMLVIFDSVWDPYPQSGKQPKPEPGVHNSGWVQSPGAAYLQNPHKWGELETYVKDLISTFKADKRILAWDIYNEPDNDNPNSYGENNRKVEIPNKKALGVALLKASFAWAREAAPSQPITAAPWYGDWSSMEVMSEMDHFLFTHSDIITFHSYDGPEEFSRKVDHLKKLGRPLICTEYMARPYGSTFKNILPIAKENQTGMINWGFVNGKSNTIYPWDSWGKTYNQEPIPWFHDILRADGTPYLQAEVNFIKEITETE